MNGIGKPMIAIVFTLSVIAFASGSITIEPDYIEIVDTILEEYQNPGEVSPQWTSGDPDSENYLTHGFITQTATDLLRNNYSPANIFYNNYRSLLTRGSVLPDFDETNGIYAWHFYGENGLNYAGGSTTAYTKCIEHYNTAVQLYTAGSANSAMEELGRALHYLQDVNVPHHAMNKIAAFSNHIAFEQEVEDNMASYALTSMVPAIFTLAQDPLGDIIDYFAVEARGWYDHASSSELSQREMAAAVCVRNSQRATITILYKFMSDVGAI